MISSKDIRLQAAERSLWCVVNIITNFIVICAMQQTVKLLHSKCALSITKSAGSRRMHVWIKVACTFTFHGVK